MSKKNITIVEFQPELAAHFKTINEEWISEMFSLESKDIRVLANPQREILDGGGHILFAAIDGVGIVGAGALLKTGSDEYELTKMGVLKIARGYQAGDQLLKALIEKSKSIGAKTLYLLTNSKCEAAIHLYEKNGFIHDREIMERFGCQYKRCDVAMRYQS